MPFDVLHLACLSPVTWQGHEYEAMLSFPFDRHTLLLLSVERPNAQLASLLVSRGFRYVCDHGVYGDEMWVLAPSKAHPPSHDPPLPTSKLPHCTPAASGWFTEKPRCMPESQVLVMASRGQDPCRGDDDPPGPQLFRRPRRRRCLVTAVEPNGGQRWVLVVGRNNSCNGGEIYKRTTAAS